MPVPTASPVPVPRRRRGPRPAVRRAAVVGLVLAALGASVRQADAQRAGALSGQIVDRVSRQPIAGVRVQLVGTRVAAFTDSLGRFGMQGLPNGEVAFEARALGYRQQRWPVVLPVGMTVERVFEMEPVDLALDTVRVAAPEDRNWRSLAGFEMRRRRGMGYFITQEMIDERQANTVTDLLRIVPGLIGTCRGTTCDFQMMASGINCRPEWFLDGYPASNATGWDFPARTVGAVEVYRSLFEVPPEFQRSNLRCGVIAIWSRGMGGRQ